MKIINIAFLLFITCNLHAQQVNYLKNLYKFIEDASVFELNQEEGRAYHIPEKHISLNGDWKFFWSNVPEGIPDDFYEEKFNDRKNEIHQYIRSKK